MDAHDIVDQNGEPIATILVKNNNRAIFMLIVEESSVDLNEQCIISPN